MPQTTADPLLEWRSEFPIVETCHYLVNNSLGAMPRSARARVGEFLDLWEQRGVRAWADEWWVLKDQVADMLARTLGVRDGTVSMHQNVAMASECVVSCFEFTGPRNKIVYTDMNFPSVMYLYEQQARRGAEIVRVPGNPDGITIDMQRLLDAIDEQTLLVPVSHALFRTSYLKDARAIVEKARRVGAFVILDVFQSIGTYPLQLEDWGVHAAVGGALKYMCGGPGNCFLYVHPDEIGRLQPKFTGWAAHRDPFAFSTEGQDYREDGGRFLNGTPNVPALYSGYEGVRIINEIGVDKIRAKSQRLTQKIIERAQAHELNIRSPLDPEQRSGHVSLDVDNGYEVCQILLEDDIIVDYRPEAGIRLSPHFYTREEECITAVDRLAEIIARGEHLHLVGQDRKPG